MQFYIALFCRGFFLGLAKSGPFLLVRRFLLGGRFFLMLAVQFAVNIFKNAAGKGICKQVAQHVML